MDVLKSEKKYAILGSHNDWVILNWTISPIFGAAAVHCGTWWQINKIKVKTNVIRQNVDSVWEMFSLLLKSGNDFETVTITLSKSFLNF